MNGDAPHDGRPDDVTRAGILTSILETFEKPGRVIDLGCGLGWYTRIPAGLGWKATGIDARDRGWPAYRNCEFRQQDVRDVDLRGYDLVLCLGLLYHMTFEDQMALLAKCRGKPLIIDTHVCKPGSNKVTLERAVFIPDDIHAVEGGLFAEGNFDSAAGTLSSWRNAQSFWPTEQGLGLMLQLHGYAATAYEPWWAPDRTFWVCLPRS